MSTTPTPVSSLSDEEVLSQHDDLEMMRRTHLWPLADKLPLWRYTNPGIVNIEKEYGVLVWVQAPWESGTYAFVPGLLGFLEQDERLIGGDLLLRTLANAGWRVD